MTWIKIDRYENGFATIETLNTIAELHKNEVPIAIRYCDAYEMFSPHHNIYYWMDEIERDVDYTYYLPLPKLEV